MEGGCGGRQRLSPLDRLSADENSRGSVGNMTLESILSSGKRSTPVNRTLLDIIRDEEPNGSLFGHKDKKSWKAFRDRLRLKRTGAAWTSSVHIPTSDVPLPRDSNSNNRFTNNSSRSLLSRRNSVRFTTLSSVGSPESEESDDNSGTDPSSRPQISRRVSTRYDSTPAESTQSDHSDVNIHSVEEGPPSRSFRPQISRHNSTRYPAHDSTHSEENDVEPAARGGTRRLAVVLAEERQLSAREAVAAQEAAEAAAQAEAAAAAAAEEAEEDASPGSAEAETEAQQPPVRMSLMDLLEETDRQMGFVGSRYTMGDYEEGEEEEEEEVDDGGETGGVEHTCCVCMVRHKGAAFIPCGHTFCRLCSRELWVQRGNCPLCNGFILEILDIF